MIYCLYSNYLTIQEVAIAVMEAARIKDRAHIKQVQAAINIRQRIIYLYIVHKHTFFH